MHWPLIAIFASVLPLIAMQGQPTRNANWAGFTLAHPKARLLVGLDWRRVTESPLGPVLLKQVSLGGHPLLGLLDSIENVDRLLVSSPGGESETRALLVIGEGRFALPKIRAMAKADGAISKRYNDVELLVPPGATNDDLHFALLDGQTILFGDGASVKGAIDRWMRTPSEAPKGALLVRAKTLAGLHDVWAVIQEPADTLPQLGLASGELAEQVESMELAISATQSFSAHLTLSAKAPEALATLGQGLPPLLELIAISYSGQPGLAQLAKRVRVATEGNLLRIGFTADSKLLDQTFAELRESGSRRMEATALPAPAVASMPMPRPSANLPAALKPGEKRVIKIQTEDGVREVPFQPAPF